MFSSNASLFTALKLCPSCISNYGLSIHKWQNRARARADVYIRDLLACILVCTVAHSPQANYFYLAFSSSCLLAPQQWLWTVPITAITGSALSAVRDTAFTLKVTLAHRHFGLGWKNRPRVSIRHHSRPVTASRGSVTLILLEGQAGEGSRPAIAVAHCVWRYSFCLFLQCPTCSVYAWPWSPHVATAFFYAVSGSAAAASTVGIRPVSYVVPSQSLLVWPPLPKALPAEGNGRQIEISAFAWQFA